MPETFGQPTKPTVILKMESHKLHEEFEVPAATPVRYAQPVKFNNDGQVVPLAAGDHKDLGLGISIHNSAQNPYGNSQVTIALKGYAKVLCRAVGNIAPGPVVLDATVFESIVGPPLGGDGRYTGAEWKDEPWYGLNRVAQGAAGDDDIFGIAIEPADDGEDVEVIIL